MAHNCIACSAGAPLPTNVTLGGWGGLLPKSSDYRGFLLHRGHWTQTGDFSCRAI